MRFLAFKEPGLQSFLGSRSEAGSQELTPQSREGGARHVTLSLYISSTEDVFVSVLVTSFDPLSNSASSWGRGLVPFRGAEGQRGRMLFPRSHTHCENWSQDSKCMCLAPSSTNVCFRGAGIRLGTL